ncbi:hypothetical protein [Halobellus inordinatus]|uniref:hypothetical protein n=1 Tax=Halobellus inordinatus TaxID=1126236 RepID=UPI00210B6D3D|nr:hypothetical protein [Halobellus inordinatus]
MPSTKQSLAILGIVTALLGGAYVAGIFDSRPPSDPTAERLAHQAANATAEVPAYSFTVGGSVTVERGGDEKQASYWGHGGFNRSERRYRIEIGLADDRETRFLQGRTRYTPCPYSRYVNVANVSYATELPQNRSWTTDTILGGQRQLFEFARVYDRGTSTVGGEAVRVVEVVPDQSKLASVSLSVPGEGDVEQLNRNADELRAMLYLSSETHLPRRVVVHRERGGFGRPSIEERIVYDFTYGPNSVERPPRTVDNESACPTP